jgi:lysophospholipase L1-like esterase
MRAMMRLFTCLTALLTSIGFAAGQSAAYTANPSGPYGVVGDSSGLNIGHVFTVKGSGIKVYRLGVFDYGADGLNAAHTVTLFRSVDGAYTPVSSGSVTVPAGQAAALSGAFRYAALPAPVSLEPGTYAVIAYQMNGYTNGSDPYGEYSATGFNACADLADANFSAYQFTTASSPAYPTDGSARNLASASFEYLPLSTNPVQTVAYTATTAGVRGQLGDNTGLNIGHSFTVSCAPVQIFSLGVYDYGADGLASGHLVTLFAKNGSTYTAVSGGTAMVPSGTGAALNSGFRFAALAKPVVLPVGSYAIIAYQMNGNSASDPYAESDGAGFSSDGNVADAGFSPYEFTTAGSPRFPSGGAQDYNFGCVSFTYATAPGSDFPATVPSVSPTLAYVKAGQSLAITASSFGTAPISYQWYYGTNRTPIAGATNAVLMITNARPIQSPGHQGAYSVSAGNAFGGPFMNTNTPPLSVTVIPGIQALRILPLGDSITYGQGAPGGYRAPLYQLLTATNYNVRFVGTQNNNAPAWLPEPAHEGHSGNRIDQIASGFLTWVNAVPDPDIILLLIGTNDYGQSYDTAHAATRFDQLVWLICTNRPAARLVVANLTLRTDDAAKQAAIDAGFNPAVPSIVANHVKLGHHVSFVDLRSALGSADLIDGLHPNQSGYNKMAAAWFKAITGVLPPMGSTNAFLRLTNAAALLSYNGVPDTRWRIDRTTNLAFSSWTPLGTNDVAPAGSLVITDSFTDLGGLRPQAAFYRLLRQ